MMLNFFANAAPSIIPISEDKVDVNFIVEEKPAGQANANMGYTQSIGMTGGGGLALPNFRGKGQSLSIVLGAMQIRIQIITIILVLIVQNTGQLVLVLRTLW